MEKATLVKFLENNVGKLVVVFFNDGEKTQVLKGHIKELYPDAILLRTFSNEFLVRLDAITSVKTPLPKEKEGDAK